MKQICLQIWNFIVKLISKITSKNLLSESAALSFYFALSLVPLVVLTISALSFLGPSALEDLYKQIQSVIGSQGADLLIKIIEETKGNPKSKTISEVLGLIILFISASSVFSKLKETLNSIFETQDTYSSTKSEILGFLKQKLFSIILMIFTILIIISSLVVSIIISFLFSKEMTGGMSELLNQLSTFAIYTVVFALIFYFGPSKRLPKVNSLMGGIIASVGFLIGKNLISQYLSSPELATYYGAAGSFIILLGFVYYSSFVFFVSALITAMIPKNIQIFPSFKFSLSNNKKKIVVSIIAALIIFRAFLPILIKNYLNDYMAHNIQGYVGHIGDFDLSIYRGAYQVEEFTFKKKNGNKEIPFITINHADISVSWKALFQGKVLLDLKIDNSRVDFLDSKNKENRQFGVEEKSTNWMSIYQKIVPFSLQTLNINNGEIHFQNKDSKPQIDIFISKIQLEAKNIGNIKKEKGKLFSTYNFSALAQNHATIKSSGSFNILAEPIAFDINAKIENAKLPMFNNFFLVYGPFDLTKGVFNFYTELASKNDKIAGYVKPVFEDVDVISGKENINSLKRFGFEVGTAVLNLFFRDGQTYNVATKIPISGNLKKPQFGLWEGFKSAISNAFGGKDKKIKKKIDNSINLNSVEKNK